MEHTFLNRKSARKPLALAAKCRTLTGMSDEGFLSDISAHGCCVTTRVLLFRVGSRIIVKPDGLEAIGGIVRWASGNRAGVEFESPLYGPVVEHLSGRNPFGAQIGIRHRPY